MASSEAALRMERERERLQLEPRRPLTTLAKGENETRQLSADAGPTEGNSRGHPLVLKLKTESSAFDLVPPSSPEGQAIEAHVRARKAKAEAFAREKERLSLIHI